MELKPTSNNSSSSPLGTPLVALPRPKTSRRTSQARRSLEILVQTRTPGALDCLARKILPQTRTKGREGGVFLEGRSNNSNRQQGLDCLEETHNSSSNSHNRREGCLVARRISSSSNQRQGTDRLEVALSSSQLQGCLGVTRPRSSHSSNQPVVYSAITPNKAVDFSRTRRVEYLEV